MNSLASSIPVRLLEQLGRRAAAGVEEAGYIFALFIESIFWIFCGAFYRQPIRIPSVFTQMMQIGIAAIPIVFVLSFAIGVMLAIQGIQGGIWHCIFCHP
jgi:ABC-type transporter Mla maintaining outer membrane lipid asymmetry permease subunit MlaE